MKAEGRGMKAEGCDQEIGNGFGAELGGLVKAGRHRYGDEVVNGDGVRRIDVNF